MLDDKLGGTYRDPVVVGSQARGEGCGTVVQGCKVVQGTTQVQYGIGCVPPSIGKWYRGNSVP